MINGNLAYKNEYVHPPVRRTQSSAARYNTYYGQYRKKPAYAAPATKNHVHTKENINTFEKEKRQMVHRKITLVRIVYMSLIVLSALFMISKFVAVRETAGEIKTLTSELEKTRAYTSQRVFELERNIDLSEVEEIATSELGMQRPENYQIIYVNVDKDDVSEVKASDVEGAGNHMREFFGKLKANIFELFGID